MSFGCDTKGGIKTIELGPSLTSSSSSSQPTLRTSAGTGTGTGPSASPNGEPPGQGVIYGKFQRGSNSDRLGRIRHERSNVRT